MNEVNLVICTGSYRCCVNDLNIFFISGMSFGAFSTCTDLLSLLYNRRLECLIGIHSCVCVCELRCFKQQIHFRSVINLYELHDPSELTGKFHFCWDVCSVWVFIVQILLSIAVRASDVWNQITAVREQIAAVWNALDSRFTKNVFQQILIHVNVIKIMQFHYQWKWCTFAGIKCTIWMKIIISKAALNVFSFYFTAALHYERAPNVFLLLISSYCLMS